ncbi:Uncharacterised protein [Listeria monocytogenes]|nr:putative membrane protein [Listeria monocytogenes]UNB89228.1 hypothetical protein K1T44_0099 [Listeria innocua]APH80704.2 putative membrane protein [Listeria monocytogenes]QQP68118.1 hypothetical protein I8J47_01692 [Listeria monocytogenes]RJY70774.1 hypothetical protein DYZ32_01082 [Listeria monocytogenes]
MSWITPYVPIIIEAVLVIGIVFIGFKLYKKFGLSKK